MKRYNRVVLGSVFSLLFLLGSLATTPVAFGCGTPNNPGGNCKDAGSTSDGGPVLLLDEVVRWLRGAIGL